MPAKSRVKDGIALVMASDRKDGRRPRVLVIGGSDPSGGAGIQLDLLALHELGCHASSVVTAITAQNSRGVNAVHSVEPKWLIEQLDAVSADISFDATKIGMVGSGEGAMAIADWLHGKKAGTILLDPVVSATDGTLLSGHPHRGSDRYQYQSLIEGIISLASESDILLPNLPEAAQILGLPFEEAEDDEPIAIAGRISEKIGGRLSHLILKGGHRTGGEVVDLYFDCSSEGYLYLSSPRADREIRGTGCYLASTLAGLLASGQRLPKAADMAKSITYQAIVNAELIGGGAYQIVPSRGGDR